jgi:hypothetical protein
LGGEVGDSVAPADSAEARVDEGDDGLKCPPETGPNMRMIAYRPPAMAAAFSNSWGPVSWGESCWAAMPEPITSAARECGAQQFGE